MASFINKLPSLSAYDMRTAARAAQNTIFSSGSSELEQLIRAATNTDSWGPSTDQLAAISRAVGGTPDRLLGGQLEADSTKALYILSTRINSYLASTAAAAAVTSSSGSGSSSHSRALYTRAVRYVNGGSEWRIVLKCLKVAEYIVLHNAVNESQWQDSGLKHTVKKVCERYGDADEVLKNRPPGAGNWTAAQLSQVEQDRLVARAAADLTKLLDDPEYREKRISVASKTSNLESLSNGAEGIPVKLDEYSNYKSKDINPSKLEHSNIKNEVRNNLSHYIFYKKSLPGKYTDFNKGVGGGFSDVEQLEEPEYRAADDSAFHDFSDNDFGEFTDSNFSDTNTFETSIRTSKPYNDDNDNNDDDDYNDDDDDDDDFGEFQASTTAPIKSSEPDQNTSTSFNLLDFDKESSPTGITAQNEDSILLKTTVDASFNPQPKSSTSTSPSRDTFADLFQNAKLSK